MWTEGMEILLKVLGISSILELNMRASRALLCAWLPLEGALRLRTDKQAPAGLASSGADVFSVQLPNIPSPTPTIGKKKVSEQAKSRKNDPNAAVESYVSSQTISGSNFGPNKPKKKTANSTFKADSIEIIYNPNVVSEAEWAFFSKRANITRLNNLFCLCWWFMSVLGVKYFPPQLRRL